MSVAFSADGPVGTIVISRPERRNALNHGALEELHDGVRRAAESGVRVVVLTGDAGHFCSGADLMELEDLTFTLALREVLDDLAGLAVPTIASISGACMGLGMQLALSCDLRVATEEARFAVPVAKLGLMVDHWTIQRLALLAGHSTARWLVLTGRPIRAERAHQVGLVHELVDGVESVDQLAADISVLAPLALTGSKTGLDLLERDAATIDPDGTYRLAFETAWGSDDLVEGRTAFRDGRPPVFRGR